MSDTGKHVAVSLGGRRRNMERLAPNKAPHMPNLIEERYMWNDALDQADLE
jgi:hypothetical protein